jgi:alpha-tubulin suppressor-like RCC1 family protein
MKLRWLLAIIAAWCLLPPAATAEQSSQPSSTASAGLDVGRYHACAPLPDARIRCWGYGGDGSLGYGNRDTIGDDETPAAAGPVDLGAGRTVVAFSAGDVHSCAVLDGGDVRCWGFSGDGRLGYGNATPIGDDEAPGSAGPVDFGDGHTAKAITAGGAHSCAVLDDDTVRCWGYGFDGRLGYAGVDPRDDRSSSIGDNETPAAVGPVNLGMGRTARAVTAGRFHTCALLDDGAVRCWGLGSSGQLGYGNVDTIGDNETPDTPVDPVKLGPAPAVALSAGAFHTCALLADGKVRCWGFGGNGRLGYGNTDSIGDSEPVDSGNPVDLGPRRAVAISAGGDHTCAVLDDGTVRCWGFGANGRLGYANKASIGDNETPGSAGPVDLGAGRTAVAISVGGDSTCARLDDGGVRCWGEGGSGRLGYCSTSAIGDDETPGSVGPVDLGVPGSRGAGCASPPEPPSAPAPGLAAVPAPSGPAPGPSTPPRPSSSPSVVRVPSLASVAGLAGQKRRATALGSCLRGVARRASDQRRRARRVPARKRAGARRQITRLAASRRRGCLKRHGRTPGRVTTLAAKAASSRRLTLTFRATGTEFSKPPAARRYVIKQSRRPIRSARDFRRADALCRGTCSFRVSDVGAKVTLTVTDLRRRSTYYYAVVARDNVSARIGRRSKSVRVRTG